MKVAFVSDTHFGYSRFCHDALAQGSAAILDACKRADVLLLGGDIFDERKPSIQTLTQVALLLQHAQRELPNSTSHKVLGIHGTHELSSKDAINPLAMMAKLGLMEDVHNKTVIVEKNETKPAQNNPAPETTPPAANQPAPGTGARGGRAAARA
ncbi:MAG: metallophosphoesterase, partial [Candidatus Micrarchaeota archaeon]